MKNFVRTFFVVLFFVGFWFGIFEFGARAWVPKFGAPLDRARLVLEPDTKFLWRSRPGFDGEFAGFRLRTDSSGFRIPAGTGEFQRSVADADWILIGPASGFGWGVEEYETYISLAAASAKKTYANVSQIGYGLSQGRRLYEDLRRQISSKPRTFFIALGAHDIDRFRFFGPSGTPDETVFSSPDVQAQLLIEKWLYRWAFPSVFFQRIQEARFKFGCPPDKTLAMRTTVNEFLFDLNRLLQQIAFDGHRAVVIDTPARYPFQPDPDLAVKAAHDFEESAKAALEGDCKLSRALFKTARLAEPHRIALDIQNLNRGLKRESLGGAGITGHSKSGPNWTLIEASGLVIVESDFVDPTNFSAAGHRKVASMIRRVLQPPPTPESQN